MHDEVEVVDQYPISHPITLDVGRLSFDRLQSSFDAVDDSCYLPRAATRADHEEVGEGIRLAKVKNDEVFRILVPCCVYGFI